MKILSFFLLVIPSFLMSQQLVSDTIAHDGLNREFLITIPTDYNGSEAMPLVFNFHGFTSNATEQMWYGDFRTIAEREGFILVHPQGTEFNGLPHWNVGGWTTGSGADDVGFTESMIDYLIENYNIDESRIYSTGMSNGGFMSYLLACQLNDRIAAVASVTGSMTPEIYNACNPSHPTPILQIHGTSDDLVPYDGADFTYSMTELLDYWTNFNSCTVTPEIIEIEDTNTSDGCTATHYIYKDCNNNITNEHFKIEDGGHTWPGSVFGGVGTNQDINASEEIWKFFSRHNLNGGISSIEDGLIHTSVNVYPNPTTGFVNIESQSIQDFKLFDLLGKEILNGKLNHEIQTLDLAFLEAGIYFLKTESTTNKIQLLK